MTTKRIKCSKHTIYNFEWSLSYILQIISFPFALHREQLIHESQLERIRLVIVSILSMKPHLKNHVVYISLSDTFANFAKLGKTKNTQKE